MKSIEVCTAFFEGGEKTVLFSARTVKSVCYNKKIQDRLCQII